MSHQRRTRILVIDNDEAMVEAICTRLGSVGYRCLTAGTGAQGLSMFSMGDVDLIITDLNMPTLDGIGFVERIRQCSNVPIIVVTGFRGNYSGRLARMSGVTILEKPFSSQVLLELVAAELASRPSRLAG